MSFRNASLHRKVSVLVASLIAMWAFGAWVTLGDGLNLFWVQTIDSRIYQPTEPLLDELQTERRLTMEYLARPSGAARQALDGQRRTVDGHTADLNRLARGWLPRAAASDELNDRVDEVTAKLAGLDATRHAVDSATTKRDAAAGAFTDTTDAIFHVYDAMGSLDDPALAADTANLIRVNRARDLVSQEDALLSGTFAASRITPAEQERFIQLVGAQRFLLTETVSRLPSADRARYDQMTASAGFTRFRDLEDRVIAGRPGGQPPVSDADWRAGIDSAMTGMAVVVRTGGDSLVQRATPIAAWIVIRMLLATGLGLAAVIVSVATARTFVGQLDRLRNAAMDLASNRLPNVVARVGRGETVDVAKEAPPMVFATPEIGQVGRAFNTVQETAIRTATEQAELRRTVRDVFLSLARRTQALVHRQLSLLDAMERREEDPAELEELFRVDHLATRMRRNAENLIVLSGSRPGRAWRRDVPMIDVIRGAMGEVEEYTRVTVLPTESVALVGRAVGDVIHLLAELIENGLAFAPPTTGVQVSGQMVANGYVVEVEDRGLGMSRDEIARVNDQIANQREFQLASTAQLGLYVVSQLAARHGIRVRLKENAYSGTTAVVLIPQDLVTDGIPAQRIAAIVASDRKPAVPDNLDRPDAPVRNWTGPTPASETPLTPIEQPQPATSHPEETVPPRSGQTESGLPLRVRQANLAPPLATSNTEDDAADAEAMLAPRRSPDELRRRMSSYQRGTLQGRRDAEQLDDDSDIPPSHR
jgi:signal transduction histidine kinase